MSVREFLGANTDVVDSHLVGTNSYFVNKRPIKNTNYVFAYHDVNPTNSIAYNSQIEFQIPRSASVLGEVILSMTLGALSSTGATGGSSYPRWVDDLGYQLISSVEVLWSQNRIAYFTGDDIKVRHAMMRTTDDSLADLVKGGLQGAAATRYTNGQSALTLHVPLPMPWSDAPKTFLPYSINMIRDMLRVRVTLKALTEVTETDGSDISSTLSVCKLICKYVHLSQEEEAMIKAEIQSDNDSFGTRGWSRLITDYVRQDNLSVANSTAVQTFTLNSLHYPIKELFFYIRQTSDIPTGLQSARNTYNFQAVSSAGLRGQNQTLWTDRPHDFLKYYINNEYHSADPSANIYALPFSFTPQALNDQFGYLVRAACPISVPLVRSVPVLWSRHGLGQNNSSSGGWSGTAGHARWRSPSSGANHTRSPSGAAQGGRQQPRWSRAGHCDEHADCAA